MTVDDVSGVEHEMNVKVHGKNFFNTKAFFTFNEANTPYISEVGDDYIILTSPENYSGNGVSYPNIKLRDLCPNAVAGNTYTFSFETDSEVNNFMYLSAVRYSIVAGKTYVFTKEMLESNIHPYGFSKDSGEAIGNCKVSNIQLEESNTPTEYTPYIDPTTVTVTAGDETYIPEPDGTVKGISSTVLADGISTDTEGVVIDCEYNVVTKTYIDKKFKELKNAILSES